jgi:thiamine pyrophosphokinase
MAGRKTAQIGLRGLRRGRDHGAVLALNGCSPAELRQALALARAFDRRPLLVAVDGGLRVFRAVRRIPDLFVGDGDSADPPTADLETVLFPRDKNFSDLAGALNEIRLRGARFASVAGLTGGRIDHAWANLFEIGRRANRFAGIVAPAPQATVVVTAEGCRIERAAGQTFSLFALSGSATVTLRGARWSLQRRQLAPGSHGLSNEARSRLELQVHRGTVALLLLARGA